MNNTAKVCTRWLLTALEFFCWLVLALLLAGLVVRWLS